MIDDILSRLEKVKRTGRNNWLACCPAHDDRSPSLSIHAADDGRIVVYCHAQCSFAEIVAAVGLGYEPWFPPKQADDFKPAIHRPFPAADILESLTNECRIVAIVAHDIEAGKDVPESDRERMRVAIMRIREASEVANAKR